ncbi:Ig-like domain-containing protein, partial [Shewanella surugensis]|uniref:Ig-like domain-containing protein n=1 Tax=Shewanella surugensis TaxID=212020 RepID=UPI0024B116CB
ALGSFTLSVDGAFSFTPSQDYNGPVPLITYELTDGSGPNDTSTLTITVTPENDAPNALNNSYDVDTAGNVNGNMILDDTGSGHDNDIDGNALSITSIDGSDVSFINSSEVEIDVEGGVLTINENGAFTYQHDGITLAPTSFTYTVSDSNGSSNTATVEFQIYNAYSLTPDNDVNSGTDAHDTIVSDVTSIIAGEDLNIAFIVDSSGSIGDNNMEIIKTQLVNVFTTLIATVGSGSGVVNISLIDFDWSATTLISIDLSDTDALDSIINAVNNLDSGGYTNYVAAFTEAHEWFQSGLPSATNLAYFITDGQPSIGGTFQDALDAFATLDSIADIQALGMGNNINDAVLAQFDSDGEPINNIDADDLADAILHTNSTPGNDTVGAGDGHDITFGDLIEFNGINAQGTAALNMYVATEKGDESVTDADTHHYISQNASDFDMSGPDDGDDILAGGPGNDILYGQGGHDLLLGGDDDDRLFGGTGDDTLIGGLGYNVLTGGDGADAFVFLKTTDKIDYITDFDPTEDIIDISHLISQDLNTIDQYLDISLEGDNTILNFDSNFNGTLNQKIVLENFNAFEWLSLSEGSSQSDVINGFINDGGLIIDTSASLYTPFDDDNFPPTI